MCALLLFWVCGRVLIRMGKMDAPAGRLVHASVWA